MTAVLLDYLLYYPSIDDGTLDEQVMDNTVTLPRYTDGKGVQMMAITTGVRTGGQTFQVKYTNSDGVAGRLSSICTHKFLQGRCLQQLILPYYTYYIYTY